MYLISVTQADAGGRRRHLIWPYLLPRRPTPVILAIPTSLSHELPARL